MPKLHIDVETRSQIDLKKTGVHKYAADASTDLWCACYATDDGLVELWVPGDPVPSVILELNGDWEVFAHNAAFERTIWKHILAPRYGWPEPALEQWRCTMAMAAAMALPLSLDHLGTALQLAIQKDAAGRRLMLAMAKPRTPRQDEPQYLGQDAVLWWDDEPRRQRLYNYCIQDVETEREAEKRLLPLRQEELAIWQLDQVINDRGIAVDVPLCHAALRVIDTATTTLNNELSRLTDGCVSSATNVIQLKTWLKERGVYMETLDKDSVEQALADQSIGGPTRRVLEIRREAAKASVKKVQALLNGTCADGRARGLLQYHAASTGRWAGRRFQPQNLKRPTLEDVGAAIDLLLALGDARALEMAYGEPLAVVGDCLRGLLVGHDLLAADFSNIEGRVLAWLAGEAWKLDAFRAYDRGTGPDLYKLAVADLFNIPVEEVTKEQRQLIGKVLELASGFGGGHGAYLKFGVEKALPTLTPIIRESADNEEWARAWDRYDPKRAYGLAREDWTVIRIVIDRWRARHSAIKALWANLEDAAMHAVKQPGSIVKVDNKVAFKVRGSFLWVRLPSGRSLCYPYPEVRLIAVPWGQAEAVTYWGIDSRSSTKQWARQTTYGGMWAENLVQAIARDIMAAAMLRTEAAGYHTVLTVHDEVVAEVPKEFGSVEEFSALMAELPPWAAGLPIAVEAWRGERYRK